MKKNILTNLLSKNNLYKKKSKFLAFTLGSLSLTPIFVNFSNAETSKQIEIRVNKKINNSKTVSKKKWFARMPFTAKVGIFGGGSVFTSIAVYFLAGGIKYGHANPSKWDNPWKLWGPKKSTIEGIPGFLEMLISKNPKEFETVSKTSFQALTKNSYFIMLDNIYKSDNNSLKMYQDGLDEYISWLGSEQTKNVLTEKNSKKLLEIALSSKQKLEYTITTNNQNSHLQFGTTSKKNENGFVGDKKINSLSQKSFLELVHNQPDINKIPSDIKEKLGADFKILDPIALNENVESFKNLIQNPILLSWTNETLAKYQITIANFPEKLTPSQFLLLEFLVNNANSTTQRQNDANDENPKKNDEPKIDDEKPQEKIDELEKNKEKSQEKTDSEKEESETDKEKYDNAMRRISWTNDVFGKKFSPEKIEAILANLFLMHLLNDENTSPDILLVLLSEKPEMIPHISQENYREIIAMKYNIGYVLDDCFNTTYNRKRYIKDDVEFLEQSEEEYVKDWAETEKARGNTVREEDYEHWHSDYKKCHDQVEHALDQTHNITKNGYLDVESAKCNINEEYLIQTVINDGQVLLHVSEESSFYLMSQKDRDKYSENTFFKPSLYPSASYDNESSPFNYDWDSTKELFTNVFCLIPKFDCDKYAIGIPKKNDDSESKDKRVQMVPLTKNETSSPTKILEALQQFFDKGREKLGIAKDETNPEILTKLWKLLLDKLDLGLDGVNDPHTAFQVWVIINAAYLSKEKTVTLLGRYENGNKDKIVPNAIAFLNEDEDLSKMLILYARFAGINVEFRTY